MNQNQDHELTNFLVLNSLSFFEKSLPLMEKHESIHLYLDLDNAGRKYTNLALKDLYNLNMKANYTKDIKISMTG